jgi:hypothetical protein
VTMLILGQGWPLGITSGSCGDSSVHGQPCLSADGLGSIARVGDLMRFKHLLMR